MARERRFAGRGGEKLEAALEGFAIDVTDLACADFGCNVGGFTDCLLRRGAGKVYAIDTGYGKLAWSLRRNERVVVLERTNALHCPPPETVDLVAIDLGWTPQVLSVPAAKRWLGPGGRIVSLLKPHYELAKLRGRRPHRALSDDEARQAFEAVCGKLAAAGLAPAASMVSPLRGKGGNLEFLLLI